MTARPDLNVIATFCHDQLPRLLHEACEVDLDEAAAIGDDVLMRAEAYAALDEDTKNVLIAPFLEEAVHHEPDEASLRLRAATVVVVRNSRLEEAHVHGPINSGGIRAVTTYAAAPLSHLLAARRTEPATLDSNLFGGLQAAYPRAWACFAALSDIFEEGGRQGYRAPSFPVPSLPSDEETVETRTSERVPGAMVQSAIDPRFNQQLMDLLREAAKGDFAISISALSRISRNNRQLMRVVEFLLAHQSVILTTNCMLRAQDVWVRRGRIIQPDSHAHHAGLKDRKGLVGAHAKMAQQLLVQLAPDEQTK